jgi:hypothetical protein
MLAFHQAGTARHESTTTAPIPSIVGDGVNQTREAETLQVSLVYAFVVAGVATSPSRPAGGCSRRCRCRAFSISGETAQSCWKLNGIDLVCVLVDSGESSQRNDLGRIYTIKFWLTNSNMHVKSKNYRTTNKNQDVTF